ncbi:hypothetical protein QL285_048584 [Trifolium repens]|jgi:hypothetical protein|nr:hypothetical protein QL285_048584 [Trifolium repens]
MSKGRTSLGNERGTTTKPVVAKEAPFNNIPLVICNPVTGEFIKLPVALNTARVRMVGQAGFGFHSKTNEYKVRRRHVRHVFEPLILEIHTLGKLLWRNVEVDPEISIWNPEIHTSLD